MQHNLTLIESDIEAFNFQLVMETIYILCIMFLMDLHLKNIGSAYATYKHSYSYSLNSR